MCGLTGYLDADGGSYEEMAKRLELMTHAISHRGPDADGLWVDKEAGVGLGHRRLSIVDLSAAGQQPMTSSSGRFVMVFNGEIYNHQDIRRDIVRQSDNVGWRGHSDTETLLVGFDTWGVVATVKKSVGMFAFALWDRQEKTLTLGRDRMGEKPLYYGWQGEGNNGAFLFGSELKALRQHPSFYSQIDRNALCLLLRYNYIPAPHAIYQRIRKLEPGTLLTVSLETRTSEKYTYWSVSETVVKGCSDPFSGGPEAAVDGLEELLKRSIGEQMVADVPVGAFLSGGVDSSAVVALMQSQSNEAVKTFTIGFSEARFDEAVYARAVAKHLGTEHTELYVSPEQVLAVIPKLPELYCEPFADSSQIPTFLVAQLAQQQVKVSLSGDGGDELFCGYNRYLMTQLLWKKMSHVPRGARQFVAHGLGAMTPARINAVLAPIQQLLPDKFKLNNLSDKMHKASDVLSSRNLDELYKGLVSQWEDPASVVLDGGEPADSMISSIQTLEGLDEIQKMMAMDAVSYLPDDILVKLDRAAMGVSLEGRVPFLDHRIVEYSWQLPLSMKLKDGVGKWVLRQVLYRHVPKKLIDRPKMGFALPISEWLRGPLKDWAEALLDEKRLKQEGFFDPLPIRQKWAEHKSCTRDWHSQLWSILMFQVWLEAEKSEVR